MNPNPHPHPFIRPTTAHIDLSRLTANFRLLREQLPYAVGILAVVKADGYGHGAVPIAKLLEGLGVRGFAVATVEEGAELRLAGIRLPVLIMGAAFGQDHHEVITHGLTPVVGDLGDVEAFSMAATQRNVNRLGIHVKIDTGMARLGVTYREFSAFIKGCSHYSNIRVDGLSTHFASADMAIVDFTHVQLERFHACLKEAQAMGADPQLIHAANSAAALRFPRAHFDCVRPGLILYGARPSASVPDIGTKPILTLVTRINAIREVPAGTPVSYGGTHVTTSPSKIATFPVGYADGYPRSLSNKAHVLIRGCRAPVIGSICMDSSMADVTHIPGTNVGDRVTLIGEDGLEQIRPEDIADWADTIAYEIFCGISKRVPRIYPADSIF